MRRYYTDKEIADKLKNMTIICDTREQVNNHVTQYLDKNKINYISRKLNTGDYSAILDNFTLEHDVVIERKANLDELCGNLTVDRQRLEAEFIRAKADGLKVFLIIENASWWDIWAHNYRSKLSPKSFYATLLSWQVKYNITVTFCKPELTGQIIHGTLYYWLRSELEKGAVV